jgi:hypothetical protein
MYLKDGTSMARLVPLSISSNFAPSLTFFRNNPNATGGSPVMAYVATNGVVNLVDPFSNINAGTPGAPVTLIGAPGKGNTTITASARPSIIAFDRWLIIAWADMSGRMHIAGSEDGALFGNEVTWPATVTCLTGTGPCVTSYLNTTTNHVGLAVLWVANTGGKPIHYTLGRFPETVPWSPAGNLGNDSSIDSLGASSLPQYPQPAQIATAATYISWAGTDPAGGTLTFGQFVGGGSLDWRQVYDANLTGGQSVSHHGPAVTNVTNGGAITLAYTGTDNHFRAFGSLNPPPLPQFNSNPNSRVRRKYDDTSNFSPALAVADNGALFWAWTGTDGHPGSLNFQNDADMPSHIDL